MSVRPLQFVEKIQEHKFGFVFLMGMRMTTVWWVWGQWQWGWMEVDTELWWWWQIVYCVIFCCGKDHHVAILPRDHLSLHVWAFTE